MRWTWVLFFAAFLGGVNWWLFDRSVSRPPGVLVGSMAALRSLRWI